MGNDNSSYVGSDVFYDDDLVFDGNGKGGVNSGVNSKLERQTISSTVATLSTKIFVAV